jgi:GT2 family glycosyltransferase
VKRLLVIIVTYNSARIIERCLDSLREQSWPDFSVFIVDNASADDTLSVLDAYRDRTPELADRIEITRSAENLGFAKAVNRGLTHMLDNDLDAALLLNPDATAGAGMLADGLEVLAGEGVGACGPMVLYEDGRIWTAGGKVFSTSELVRGLHFGVAANPDKGTRPVPGQRPAQYTVDALPGCAFFVSAAAVRDIGGLDERFFMYVEDTEFSVRLRDNGYRIVCYTTSTAVHHTEDNQAGRRALHSLPKYRMFLASQIRYLWGRSPLLCLVWTVKLPVTLAYELAVRRRGQSSSVA